ncbi:hypothetical protein jhhlp_002394 [Lomentospora prolificans]|uniref:Arginine metabolism regulation protein II n=1 Tax=Lomentospora prolificans TaxID=41688 RepID=A0A2N3NDX8_9PEZI|nr:hypothetical protein jhhlp_002394 [Lomentospora prolificans]
MRANPTASNADSEASIARAMGYGYTGCLRSPDRLAMKSHREDGSAAADHPEMLAVPVQSILDSRKVEKLLSTIDARAHKQCDAPVNHGDGDVAIAIHNFGVFSVSGYSHSYPDDGASPVESPDHVELNMTYDEPDGMIDPQLHALDDGILQDDLWLPNTPVKSSDSGVVAAAADLWCLYTTQNPNSAIIESPTSFYSPSPTHTSGAAESARNESIFSDPLSPTVDAIPGLQEVWTTEPGFRLTPSLDIFSLPPQERYLLHYYMDKVVQLSCVIDNAKSPWKTIHLPRALQSIGQLTVTGATSRIRHTLRHDLLSISAFQLSNDHNFHNRREDAEKWAGVAAQYRYSAIGLLKQAVELDLYHETRPKYKDFLATMLSMVSINVMSGDTSSCGVHLDGAGQLICHMVKFKTQYSTKAKALHRIYYYLRNIYESTAVNNSGFGARYPIVPKEDPTYRLNSLNISEDDDAVPGPQNRPDSTQGMTTYEFVYGIPQDLLILLRRCIDAIDRVNEARSGKAGTHLPDDLEALCAEVEHSILDWSSEAQVAQFRRSFDSDPDSVNSRIIYHQTRAFHNALIIYFSQQVRLLDHRYLRQYIEAVIGSIETIEQIKADTQTLAAPLYWPAFIGASEAFEKSLQDRFRRWYDRVEMYGIGAVRTGTRVLKEVWEVGPVPNRTTCAWRSVIQRTGDVLILT